MGDIVWLPQLTLIINLFCTLIQNLDVHKMKLTETLEKETNVIENDEDIYAINDFFFQNHHNIKDLGRTYTVSTQWTHDDNW